MKKNIKRNILLILSFLLIVAAFVFWCSMRGTPINKKHFPDSALMSGAWSFDLNHNGYLSKKELKEAKNLLIDDKCTDLSGIEYLTSLENLSLNCSDLSGIEHLTNLETLNIYGNCPDLSSVEKLPNLKKIKIRGVEFGETFVFDYDISVAEIEFYDCEFTKGILFDNDSVENVSFGYVFNGTCGVSGDVVFADCDGLVGFSAEFCNMKEQNYSVDLSGCDNLDWVSITDEQVITSVDISDCRKLRSFTIYDYDHHDEPELTLNISGCPNIDEVNLGSERLKKIDITDCPHLISASEQAPYKEDYDYVYESEDGCISTHCEQLVFIDNH